MSDKLHRHLLYTYAWFFRMLSVGHISDMINFCDCIFVSVAFYAQQAEEALKLGDVGPTYQYSPFSKQTRRTTLPRIVTAPGRPISKHRFSICIVVTVQFLPFH